MIGEQDRLLMIKEFTHPVLGECGIVKELCGNPNFVKIVFDEPYNKNLLWFSRYHLGVNTKELTGIVKNEIGATDEEVNMFKNLPGYRVPDGFSEIFNGRCLVRADKDSIQKRLRGLSDQYHHALSIQRDFILSTKRLIKTEIKKNRERLKTICEAVDEEVCRARSLSAIVDMIIEGDTSYGIQIEYSPKVIVVDNKYDLSESDINHLTNLLNIKINGSKTTGTTKGADNENCK